MGIFQIKIATKPFVTGLAHLYNPGPYQRCAQHAGECDGEVEGG